MQAGERIIVVTKTSALAELNKRFGTRGQAKFYIEWMGGQFLAYENEDNAYQSAVEKLKRAIPEGKRVHWIDRTYLPNYSFGPLDLVVTLGPDGLVVNTAKYLTRDQKLFAFNPDPERIDGVLVPFSIDQARRAFAELAAERLKARSIVMARATLNDGQSIEAVNDLFIGAKTHVSARYRLKFKRREEAQSSSGIIVSTGAGSTGWMRSILAGAAAVVEANACGGDLEPMRKHYAFGWEEEKLRFHVREPFVSKTTRAGLACGTITKDHPLEIVSLMPANGLIFSDGVEEDFLNFNSGSTAKISISERKLNLLVEPKAR